MVDQRIDVSKPEDLFEPYMRQDTRVRGRATCKMVENVDLRHSEASTYTSLEDRPYAADDLASQD